MNWELNTIATDIQLVIQISPWLAVIIYNRNAYSVKPLVCLQLKCLSRNVDLPQQRWTHPASSPLTAEARQPTPSAESISSPRVLQSAAPCASRLAPTPPLFSLNNNTKKQQKQVAQSF